LPVVELGEAQTLCGEETLTLDAGNEGSTFLWSNGATTQTITVGATEFGVGTHEISVQVTSPFTCQTSDAVSVTIEALPVVALGEDQQHCGADAVVLDAGNSGSTFLWSNGETSQTISVNPDAIGYGTHEFSVSVTSPLGCQSNDAVQLTFYQAPPVANLGQDTTRCLVDQIVLTAGVSGYSYLWSNGETTESITLVGNTVGVGAKTYYVDLTSENNCVSRSTEKVVEFLDCSGLNETNAAMVDVYPVPSTGVVTLKFNQLSNETFRISVLDAAGNVVYRQDNVQTSVNKLLINLTTQPAGMYTLVLEGKTTIQKKIIINR
ncbi:MAG: T9SS type A sorting domain-containing protein, partial [Bacteroidales bacterium]